MKKAFKYILSFFIILFFCTYIPRCIVHADTGPKPDMEITITNLKQSDYIVGYATKYEEYFGPHRSFDPSIQDDDGWDWDDRYEELLTLYENVTLPDGWYLSDISSTYENTNELKITSGYYWPNDFILIIYDKTNSIIYLSAETKTYAFHSYFTYDMKNYNDKNIVFEKSYKYGKEILEFFVRLFVTFIIEIGLALLFRFNKKSLLIILITNAVTQIGLNLALNITAYERGKNRLFIILYVFLEILIVLLEALIYKIFCKRGKKQTRKWNITYAITSNVLSFTLGMLLWLWM